VEEDPHKEIIIRERNEDESIKETLLILV